MRAGVTIVDPAATWIDAEVELAPDVTIEPGTTLRGATSVGSGSVIGPMTTLIDARIGERVTMPHSYLTECEVADGAQIGPFAYLRPDARIGEDAKAGAFIEIKNSRDRRGRQGPPPLLHRRRRDRRRQRTSAPGRSPPTTTVSANTGLRSARTPGWGLTPPWWLP